MRTCSLSQRVLLTGRDEVLCVDNRFAGINQSIKHPLEHKRLQFIRRDMAFPF
jgi:hypothetical protein